MTSLPVSLAQILAARDVVAERVHRTPMLGSATAARVVEAVTGARIADGRVHLKAEHLQKTGSFKVRGAVARIAGLLGGGTRTRRHHLSAGNAAAAYAWAGSRSASMSSS